jgi:hypothetical protein
LQGVSVSNQHSDWIFEEPSQCLHKLRGFGSVADAMVSEVMNFTEHFMFGNHFTSVNANLFGL